jgi:uncharacterized protein
MRWNTDDVSNNSLTPDSPCVGYCSTSYGDDVCKGCGRTFMEVIDWITFDNQQKKAVWTRLKALNTAKYK